jgi:hypothetical protein
MPDTDEVIEIFNDGASNRVYSYFIPRNMFDPFWYDFVQLIPEGEGIWTSSGTSIKIFFTWDEMLRVSEIQSRYPHINNQWGVLCEILLKLRIASFYNTEEGVWSEFDRRFDRECREGGDYIFDYQDEDYLDCDYLWFIEKDLVKADIELQKMLANWWGRIAADDDSWFMVEVSKEEKELASRYLDRRGVDDKLAFMMMVHELYPSEEEAEPINVSSDDFPMRFGVEMEFECDTEYGNDWIELRLVEAGLDVQKVEYDGSLMSEGGFEVISNPLNCLNDVYEFMRKTKERLLDLNMPIKNTSPSAIHVHVSNVKNPTNLFLIMKAFDEPLDQIRRAHKNGLVHERLNLPRYDTLIEAQRHYEERDSYDKFSQRELRWALANKIDPIYKYEARTAHQLFMRSRRSTLRYSGYDSGNATLEFRVMPQRMHSSVYKTYVKIIGMCIKMAEESSRKECHLLAETQGRLGLTERLKVFQEFMDLDDKEMHGLFNKINSKETVFYDALKFWEICKLPEPVTKIDYDSFRIYFENYTTIKYDPVSIESMQQWYDSLQPQPSYYYYHDGLRLIDGLRTLGYYGTSDTSGSIDWTDGDVNDAPISFDTEPLVRRAFHPIRDSE